MTLPSLTPFLLGEGNGSTLFPTPTGNGPNTVSTLGNVFTSGTAYVSFETLYASYDGFWNHVGPNFTNFILPVSSAAVSTQCGGWFGAYGPGEQLNFADLNYPVPASAYNCMDRCATEGPGNASYSVSAPCSTIWDDYKPLLAIPTEVTKLVPEWSTCKGWDDVIANFWFDPPVRIPWDRFGSEADKHRLLCSSNLSLQPQLLRRVGKLLRPRAHSRRAHLPLPRTKLEAQIP